MEMDIEKGFDAAAVKAVCDELKDCEAEINDLRAFIDSQIKEAIGLRILLLISVMTLFSVWLSSIIAVN